MGSDIEIPDLTETRKQFDEWLLADPEEADQDQLVMMQALGVSGGR